MNFDTSVFFYDKRDHELIRIVKNIYDRDNSPGYTKKQYYPYFHPLGIKELAESTGLRIAYSVVQLLESLERGDENKRLLALRGVRDEILNITVGSMSRNTARVLLQIMKELVRAHGNDARQLELAHDFRRTASGKPGIVRQQLKKYHLLEMPEEWNQVTFDDHVHDANTTGRKSPTHLIMDAWIKGIRRLRVIYSHCVEPRAVAELMESAGIMGIDVRIGIEFTARHRNRFVKFLWVSRHLPDVQSYLCFLAKSRVIAFMEEGREVLEYHKAHVLKTLEAFNTGHRHDFNSTFSLSLPPLSPEGFLDFVGPGQASILHLGEYVHLKAVEAMKAGLAPLQESYRTIDPDGRLKLETLVEEMNAMSSTAVVDRYLSTATNGDPARPHDGTDVPNRMTLTFTELLTRVAGLHPNFRITLNLSDLRAGEVLELLYDAKGLITRLEIFNLKDHASGNTRHIEPINELQRAINEGSYLALKQVVRKIIRGVETSDPDVVDRKKKLVEILHDLPAFSAMYRETPLKSRIGSDSKGRSPNLHGMGFGIIDTLSPRAGKELRQCEPSSRLIVPIRVLVLSRTTWIPRKSSQALFSGFFALLRRVPGISHTGYLEKRDWVVEESTTRITTAGNIVALGGGGREKSDNGLRLYASTEKIQGLKKSWSNLNTGVKNTLKVVIGFVPAFATFALTKEWWFLAYFGAFIWFGITGLRNIVQSVLGGGGIRRSPLLRWNDYVSWERITDSLLFTGFSVPLLDYLVKTLLLDRGMGITTTSNPMALYAIMALANGVYLSAHNIFRGLPRGAVFGNFFRSILSIPIAIGLNAAVGSVLAIAGTAGIEQILQKWAAVISKAASDLVAGGIEGTADRHQNIALRVRDYRRKLAEHLESYSRLEILFPDSGELELLEDPSLLMKSSNGEVRDLVVVLVINTLDMLYFWMYQPRARLTMREMVKALTPEERRIVLMSQKQILVREKEVSLLFVEGILGSKFSSPLAFYLMRYEEYLEELKKME